MSFVFFFFKQKTAYEVPKRDWSSDVCSSDLLVLGSEVGQLFRAAHRPLDRRVVELVQRNRARALAEIRLDHQLGVLCRARGVHGIAREADVAARVGIDIDLARVGLGEVQGLLHQRAGLLLGQGRHESFLAVLMTLTPLNRLVAVPWDTALICPGWPLPSKNDPPSR